MGNLTNLAWRASALMLVLGAVAGCATTGTGLGNARTGDVSAHFAWESSDDRTGKLTADLSTGDVFSGQYFQITRDSRIENLRPLWYGWRDSWHGWNYWGPQPDTAFVTHYSGRVVANLQDAAGEHARCKFRLVYPRQGMAGGGQGECQLPSGQTIDATFPRA